MNAMDKLEEITETEIIMSPSDKKVHDEMRNLMKKPLTIQRFCFHQSLCPKHYNATVIVDKEDRISIIKAQYQLYIGANGVFIKESKKNKTGITYHKTGRSSARIRYWRGYVHTRERYDLLKELAKRVNPDSVEVFDLDMVKQLGTKGMHGYIMAGKITNLKEAMEYYIRYSMRGVGIKQENALALAKYFKAVHHMHDAGVALRVAKDPNATINSSTAIIPINKMGGKLIRLALATSIKIDWVDPSFDGPALYKRLTKKVGRIKDFLDLWEGGPVLYSKARTTRSYDDEDTFMMNL
jgi:hypothetical protein